MTRFFALVKGGGLKAELPAPLVLGKQAVKEPSCRSKASSSVFARREPYPFGVHSCMHAILLTHHRNPWDRNADVEKTVAGRSHSLRR